MASATALRPTAPAAGPKLIPAVTSRPAPAASAAAGGRTAPQGQPPAPSQSQTASQTQAVRPVASLGRATAEVPIFLQKAYHMIDTCDPAICAWSEDGLTFIVRDTRLFERTVIPQFFKHNKFSSFVRQLNFYGFRKVKFSNSLKIDHKLEAATAKFWRFRHDKFRRGRRDLLADIKRTPSASAASSAAKAQAAPRTVPSTNVQAVPGVAASAPKPQQSPEEVTNLKSEMEAMKRRIASMAENIDELTDMVKKVSVEETLPSPVVSPGAATAAGNKRKKTDAAFRRQDSPAVDDLPVMPDWNPSASDLTGVDSMLLGDQPLPDVTSSMGLAPVPPLSAPSPVPSDDAFVDDLFRAFADEDAILPGMDSLDEMEASETGGASEAAPEAPPAPEGPNKPCPRLMKRIEDSLSTLPRDMHEMVANKLIDAISDAKPIAEEASALLFTPEEPVKDERSVSVDEAAPPQAVLSSPSSEDAPSEESPAAEAEAAATAAPSIPLPLAVATLKTILAEYGVQVECRRAPCKDAAMEHRARFARSVPVVPMHA